MWAMPTISGFWYLRVFPKSNSSLIQPIITCQYGYIFSNKSPIQIIEEIHYIYQLNRELLKTKTNKSLKLKEKSMLIHDLNHLEIVDEANKLEGGNDIAASLTAFQQRLTVMQTMSTSTPAGSSAGSVSSNLNIGTFGLNFISLQP
jgi:hypothetical protein